MSRFLIVQCDANCGRGARGANLSRFLRIFHGRGAVELVNAQDLERGPVRETDVLFVGMPTVLEPQHLARIRFRQAVLFDYSDVGGPVWSPESEPWLRSLTDIYLKPWVEESWDFGLRWGVLPIRRYPGLTWHVKILRGLFRGRYPDLCRRDHEVSFLGNSTAYYGVDSNNRYYQRIDWLRELQQSRRRFAFWGGLQASVEKRALLQTKFDDLSDLMAPSGRLLFSQFFYHLLRSQVVLTPTGNARWSYRHYEAIYAGASLVSTDFRSVRTLIPLPLDNMQHVADHALVVPAIEAALERRVRESSLPRQNIDFLETYLQDGDYHRRKPQLMDEFLSQIDGQSGFTAVSSNSIPKASADGCPESRRAA
ncbi:MAG: hypothetical protein IAG10_26620 [Planctomycetaceae bacterium]|nr:hypothetical protein [Planctomycetaceae bacterium]